MLLPLLYNILILAEKDKKNNGRRTGDLEEGTRDRGPGTGDWGRRRSHAKDAKAQRTPREEKRLKPQNWRQAPSKHY